MVAAAGHTAGIAARTDPHIVTIDESLLQHLARVDSLVPDEIPRVLGRLEEIRAALWQRLLAPSATVVATPESPMPALMTVSEVASVLRFSRGHVYELIRCGDLQAVRNGRAVRVTAHALSAWSAAHQGQGIDAGHSVSLHSSGGRRSRETHPSQAWPDTAGLRREARRARGDRGEVGDGRPGHARTRGAPHHAPRKERQDQSASHEDVASG